MKVSEPPVVVEQLFDCDVESVWHAITDLSQMKQWYFKSIPDFKPIVGFRTAFEVHNEDRTFTHLWKVLEVIPMKKLVYNWKYKEYMGDSFVSFDLSKQMSKAKLIVTATVVEDFPDVIPEFKWESCKAGWNYFIKDELKAYLSNR